MALVMAARRNFVSVYFLCFFLLYYYYFTSFGTNLTSVTLTSPQGLQSNELELRLTFVHRDYYDFIDKTRISHYIMAGNYALASTPVISYSSIFLLSLLTQPTDPLPPTVVLNLRLMGLNGRCTRPRGCRSGTRRRRGRLMGPVSVNDTRISAVGGPAFIHSLTSIEPSTLPLSHCFTFPPSLYVINPTSLAKPHAIQHFQADVMAHGVDIALVCETWFKTHHTDQNVSIDGFNLFRRDRKKRRGGGVAIYIKDHIQSSVMEIEQLNCPDIFELLLVKTFIHTDSHFICAIYHPPKALYNTADLLKYIADMLDYILAHYSGATVTIAGDLNQLSNEELCSLGLLSIVNVPTHRGHCLDRIYTTSPMYSNVKVVKSCITTEHCAIIAKSDNSNIIDFNKTRQQVKLRKHSPTQFASLFNDLQSFTWHHITDCSISIHVAFERFYESAVFFLDKHFPERTVTLTSRDPAFVTPLIKLQLREKQKLMRKGKIEAANALALQIQKEITKFNSHSLNCQNAVPDTKTLWDKVNEISGKRRQSKKTDGISASALNQHYASISTDPLYTRPQTKSTCANKNSSVFWISPFAVYNALESLKHTASGDDCLPFWYLKSASIFLAEPLSYLFTESVNQSYVPPEWKTAVITPASKIPQPTCPADFRPISLTPILSRMLEKFIVRNEIYPLITQPALSLALSDQFAFRPTGSTTAALIFLLDTVSNMLKNHPYVHILALDFSKAFDSLSHSSLSTKLAATNLPDNIYNWFINYLSDRKHKTIFANELSNSASINASIVQGSALGPAAYIINAADLHPIHLGNEMAKYADDSYLIIPATNSHTIESELDHVASWAAGNNLKLNVLKTQELLVTRKNVPASSLPPIKPNIKRVTSLCVLGVTFNQYLEFTDHIINLLHKSNQTLYALKILKSKGLAGRALNTVFKCTFLTSLLYASPSWWGFISAEDRARLDSVISKAVRWGCAGIGLLPSLSDLCMQADDKLFHSVLNNHNHVLYQLLPPEKTHNYSLRVRPHNRILPCSSSSSLMRKNFFHRMLMKDSY